MTPDREEEVSRPMPPPLTARVGQAKEDMAWEENHKKEIASELSAFMQGEASG